MKYYRMFPLHIQELASAPTVRTQDSAAPASTSTKQSLFDTAPTNQPSSTAAPTNQCLFAPAIPQDLPIPSGEENDNDQDDDVSAPPKMNSIWSTKCKSCPLFGHTLNTSHKCPNNPINEGRQVLPSSLSSHPHLGTFQKTYILTGVYSLFF